ncbi:MAG: cytochrome ubiquinol oxidase subunit I [Gemmatimonadetes bacterium]|nr:cytochrome ubiquinol oxidase subunit I [Gemmatimonadota bacterium]
MLSTLAALAAQSASVPAVDEVRTFLGWNPRSVVWFVAQLHLLFAAFVLGVPIFAVIVEFIGWRTGDQRYDRLAHEFTKLLSAAFATTAALGGLMAFVLFGLYPAFAGFFVRVFAPSMYGYAGLFFVETALLYLYYNSWDRLQNRKLLHLSLGILLNVAGTAIVFIANGWTSYMMSPVGVDASGAFTGTTSAAIANPLWMPLNIHRIIGNITFGGFVVGAYAAVRYLAARTPEDRAHYDWMGYVGNFIGLGALIPLPFAGYYLGREMYTVSPVMGNNMMGGDFSWAFILQALLVGLLFIVGNYYLWTGLSRIPGAERYQKYVKYLNVILVVCVAVWLTPRNLPVTSEEQLAIGGQVHPFIGYLGLMAAKNAVINFIILATFASLLLYRRANKTDLVPVSQQGRSARVVLISVGAAAVLLLAWYVAVLLRLDLKAYNLEPEKIVYVRLLALTVALPMIAAVAAVVLALRDRGKLAQTIYFLVVVIDCVGVLGAYGFVVMTSANPLLRQIAVVQWLILMTALLLITAIDVVLFHGAQSLGQIRWGEVPATTQYALLALCVDIVLTMGLMGYVRSGLREDWHIYGVMRDTSQWAFTPSYSQMARMVGGITLVFLTAVTFLFWLAGLTGTKPANAKARETP